MVKLKSQNLRTEWCKSCGYCVAACPVGALSIGTELNSDSYAHVVLDESKCINCGKCYMVCGDYVFRFEDAV